MARSLVRRAFAGDAAWGPSRMAWTRAAQLSRSVGPTVVLALALVGCGNAALTGPVATATPTASPTATATLVPTATPKPEFADPLTSNRDGWPTKAGHCQFANGGLQISNAVCALPFFDAEDGAIAVDAVATAGGTDTGRGLVWRASGQSMYEFGIASDRSWGFVKLAGGESSTLDSGENGAILQGLNITNHLMVTFRGSHFEFFVNGVQVGEDDDSTIPSGVIGMFTTGSGTTVFNNFAYFA